MRERARKPGWLRVRLRYGPSFVRTRKILSSRGLATVCEEARCPNKGECWHMGTATFLLMGKTCTRRCGFCAVETASRGDPLDKGEADMVAEAAGELGLRYVVLTSVTRDDLPDCGAGHISRCVRALRNTGCRVEALIPDLGAHPRALEKIVDAEPDVIGHNLETVRRLQGKVRDRRAGYDTSLSLLKRIKEVSEVYTKSSLILGLGEKEEEVLEAMADLRKAGVDFLTLGQYLRPSPRHLPVVEYVSPDKFQMYRDRALEMGFRGVASGPLVRSSYRAAAMFMEGLK